MPPNLKEATNQAHLVNGTYEEIVTHLETELHLKSLEAPEELQLNTEATFRKQECRKIQANVPPPKKAGLYRNQCRLLN